MIANQEDGFTLIELLVAVTLAGIIAIAIGAVLLIGFKTTFATAQTVSQSNNAQLLAQYFPSDVQSANADGVDTLSGTGTGCSGSVPAGSSNLVRLGWVDTVTNDQFYAAYRVESTLMRRYACVAGGTPRVSTVSRDVSSAAVAVSGSKITATVSVLDPNEYLGPPAYRFSVSGTRRTPGNSCNVVGASVVVTPVPAAVDSAGHLTKNISVTFSTDGLCSAAAVSYQYGATAAESALVSGTQAGATGNWSATVPSSTNAWTTGDKRLVITAGSTQTSTIFNVYDPTSCVPVGSVAVSPNPTTVASGIIGLTTITYQTNGTCHGATTGSVTFQYGPTISDADVVTSALLSVSGATRTWLATLPVAEPAPGWTAGGKALTVSTDVSSAAGTFTVSPATACTVTAGSITPATSPAYLGVGQTGSGQLRSALPITFATSSSCSSPTLTYQYDNTHSTTVNATGGPTNWSATIPTIPAPGAIFTTGSRTLTVNAGTSATTGTYVVADGCSTTSTWDFNPQPANRSGNTLTSSIAVKFNSNAGCQSGDLTVTFQYGNVNETQSVNVAAASPATDPDGTMHWQATLPATLNGTNHWSNGVKRVWVLPLSAASPASFTVS